MLPFVLRRMKTDVLNDLPPKIIQDLECDLSPLQARLYEDFGTKRVSGDLAAVQSGSAESSVPSHIFQALNYLRKLCSHPSLVLTAQHPLFPEVMRDLAAEGSSLHHIEVAPKLVALRQLMYDCGIGGSGDDSDTTGTSTAAAATIKDEEAELSKPVVQQHRMLVFCQLKSMLDIIEQDLLRAWMPSVTYLRLDGGVEPARRQDIVSKFNADPTIDVLLLTTSVGGLGLNLTGADTVRVHTR